MLYARYMLPLLLFLVGCTPELSIHESASVPALTPVVADYSSPVATYRTYVLAIKANDLTTATACWATLDKNEDAFIEVVAGSWIATHRLEKLIATKFNDVGDDLKNFEREGCSDVALDRTLARLPDSEAKISGEIAELVVKWKESDGGGNDAVFEYSTEPRHFRKVGDTWRLDVAKTTGHTKSDELLAPGTWGSLWKGGLMLLNEILDDIDNGKILTSKQLQQVFEDKIAALRAKYIAELNEREAQRHAASTPR